MAIYHLSAQALSRSSGASAVAAAAYRSGESLSDERTGERHDYERRSGVEGAEIVAPDDAPRWALDRQQLWNAAEAAERRKNSQVAREVRVAIPAELDDRSRKELVRKFAKEQFADRGMVADVAYHDFAGENPHAHILLTMRRLDGAGFAKTKERSWNAKETLQGWRKAWERDANRVLERCGSVERIDCRTLKAQRSEALECGDPEAAERLDREPTIHLGKAAAHMGVRGIETERLERAERIEDRNRERRRAREASKLIDQLRAQLRQIRQWARRLRAVERKLRAARERLRPHLRLSAPAKARAPRQSRTARRPAKWRWPSR